MFRATDSEHLHEESERVRTHGIVPFAVGVNRFRESEIRVSFCISLDILEFTVYHESFIFIE